MTRREVVTALTGAAATASVCRKAAVHDPPPTARSADVVNLSVGAMAEAIRRREIV